MLRLAARDAVLAVLEGELGLLESVLVVKRYVRLPCKPLSFLWMIMNAVSDDIVLLCRGSEVRLALAPIYWTFEIHGALPKPVWTAIKPDLIECELA